MNWNDCASAFGDGGFNQRGVQAVSVWINVHENRSGSGEQNRRCRAFPGVSRNDDFVASANACGLQSQFQRNGSVGDGDAVFGSVSGVFKIKPYRSG